MAIDRQKLILISGLFLGVMAIFMTKMYLDQQKKIVAENARAAMSSYQSNQTSVLVAKRDIVSGSIISSDMFETSIVPNKFVQPQAVTSLDRIYGMITVAPIGKGEQITLSKLVSDKSSGRRDLAGVTPSGKRAITIIADNLSSLSGMVQPGNYVDVLAVVQLPVPGRDGKPVNQTAIVPLFQNVLVLAVGQNTGGPTGPSGRYATESAPPAKDTNLITLSLSPKEAHLIAFVQEQGRMRLVMRSPADAKMEPAMPVSWDSLFQYISPSKEDNQQEIRPPIDTTEYVEVLRGLNKEKVSISSR